MFLKVAHTPSQKLNYLKKIKIDMFYILCKTVKP